MSGPNSKRTDVSGTLHVYRGIASLIYRHRQRIGQPFSPNGYGPIAGQPHLLWGAFRIRGDAAMDQAVPELRTASVSPNRGSTIAWTVSPEKEVNQAMVAPPFPNPFASLSSPCRPPRREGIASARAGARARRPADAPTALTGGLGNPGPTVQSRNCPTLLLARCSRRSCRFVVAGAAGVAGGLLGKGSGSGPAVVRGGS